MLSSLSNEDRAINALAAVGVSPRAATWLVASAARHPSAPSEVVATIAGKPFAFARQAIPAMSAEEQRRFMDLCAAEEHAARLERRRAEYEFSKRGTLTFSSPRVGAPAFAFGGKQVSYTGYNPDDVEMSELSENPAAGSPVAESRGSLTPALEACGAIARVATEDCPFLVPSSILLAAADPDATPASIYAQIKAGRYGTGS